MAEIMRGALLAGGVVALFLQAATILMVAGHDQDRAWPWVNHGGGLRNRREAPFETKISPASVQGLSVKWEFITGFDVTATPSIADGVVYFPSNNGQLYAVKEKVGELVWEKNLTELTAGIPEIANAFSLQKIAGGRYHMNSRSTPAIAGDLLIVGIFGPSAVLAVDRWNGSLVWASVLDTRTNYSVITQGATVFESAAYIGTSSGETAEPAACCRFQGAFFKLSLATGVTIWRVPMLPDNGGQPGLYSGAAVWGSSPAIDVERRLVYIGTGNSYSVPPSVINCEIAWRNSSHPPGTVDPCLIEADHQESVVVINIDSGKIAWSKHLGDYDALGWTYFCFLNNTLPNCPPSIVPADDADFGEAPMLLTVGGQDIIVVGQKSGMIFALDRETGEEVWSTAAGPPGLGGGSIWGMTTDGKSVFTNSINTNLLNFTLLPSSQVITYGGWVALDARNGSIIWSTANTQTVDNPSPLTYANGVVFGGSFGYGLTGHEAPGQLVALDALTGKVLLAYNVSAALMGGVSIWDGCAYLGVGVTYNFGNAEPSPKNHGNSTLALCV